MADDEATGRRERYFPQHGSYGHDTLAYDLRIAYDSASGQLAGTALIQAVALRPLERVELDLARLNAYAAKVDGKRRPRPPAAGQAVRDAPSTRRGGRAVHDEGAVRRAARADPFAVREHRLGPYR